MRPLRALVSSLPLLALGLAVVLPLGAVDPCAAGAQRSSAARTTQGGPRLSVVGRVHTGIQPKSCALSPDGRRIWVANFGRPDRDNVKVYDADSLELLGTVNFPGNAVEFAFAPDGRTAYVSNFRNHTIHEIDTETYALRRTVETGGHPKVIAVAPDASRLYVAQWANAQIAEIDAESFTVTRRLRTGTNPRGMVVNEAGRLYAAAMYSHQIHVFDRDATAQATEIPRPCRYPRALALSPGGDRLYASCSCCRQVRVYDTEDHSLAMIAQTGENPRSIDLSADGRWLAVADFDDTTITLIDTERREHRVTPVPDANQIVGVAVRSNAEGVRVYATSWLTGELIVLGTSAPPAAAPPSDVE